MTKPASTLIFLALLWHLLALPIFAQEMSPRLYEIGNPTLTDIWIDPVNGNDAASGSSRQAALRTIDAAWQLIPMATTLSSTGYRLQLVAGEYPLDEIPHYLESRWGTAQFPIIFNSIDGEGGARLLSDLNIFDARYLYLIGIAIVPQNPGEPLHCEQCNHFLVRDVEVYGGARIAHEVMKVNQSQYVYVEDSIIHGAEQNSIDFVAVQYGHIVGNKIHNADDWCMYLKGGSAYFRIEANEIYNCGTGGFVAGQGTGFEYMVSPWIHYEAYDMKFINNIVHDTEGAGFGVNGGYNILFAYNTLYRVGSRSHTLEINPGLRSCDGETTRCAANLALGGWGPTTTGIELPIPNKNIFIYRNVLLNPSGFQSQYQHFSVTEPTAAPNGSNIPNPVKFDNNLKIRGNVIWNGSNSMPLGIEESNAGCQDSNTTCNEAQLLADNRINAINPQLISPASGNFRPSTDGNLFTVAAQSIPDFAGGDQVATPLAPQGLLSNSVTRDFAVRPRTSTVPPGAYAGVIRPRAAADTYLPWNGFLSMINIAELVNRSGTKQSVQLTIYDSNGDSVDAITVQIPAGGQRDIILNDMAGFVPDSYGVVTLDFSDNTIESRMSFYRNSSSGAEYDFAYSVPALSPLTGNSIVGFNTFQPSRNSLELNSVVANWLSITNLSPNASKTFSVKRYDEAGTLLSAQTISVAPFSRMDLDGGHFALGANRVGLNEIVPNDSSAPYLAQLTRYGEKLDDQGQFAGYSFAFPLFATSPTGNTITLPISNGGGAQNWVELLNASNQSVTATVRFFDATGNLVETLSGLTLAAHSQSHINASIRLASQASGSVAISSNRSNALHAQSMYYFYEPSGRIASMYGTAKLFTASSTQVGSYNLFLGMANWLKIINTSNSSQVASIAVESTGGTKIKSYTIPKHASLDIALHDTATFNTAPNTYGSVTVNGSNLFPEILRIRPGSTSDFDFVFPTVVH